MTKFSYRLLNILTTSIASMSLCLLTVGDAHAQMSAQTSTSVSPSTTTPSQPNAVTIDEAKLDKFVSAYAEIQAIQKETTAKQSATKDQTALTEIASEAQSKMTEAVKKNGLQVDEFNQISQLMLKDADLRAKVLEKLQEYTKLSG